ncbi:MAG TPA: BON domain-containing protein [Candidatus Acidoferrales bacterium]|nr:BON domain-containing protein [Candidatus Acidoferrales bacterium]
MRERQILSIATLVVALAIGCAKKVDDAALVTNIQSQMFSDSQLKDANLQVTSNKGQVTLTGTVSSTAAHLDAYKIATQTPGVTSVNDQIAVQEPQAAQAAPAPAEAKPPAETKQERRREAREKKRHPRPAKEEVAENVRPNPDSAPQPAPQEQTAPPPAEPAAAPAPAPTPPPPPPPPQPRPVRIDAGTTVTVRMIDGVDSSVNQPGEIFHASLDAPLVAGNEVVAPKGTDVYVRLVSASQAGKFSGKSELHLELIKLELHGQSYPLVSSTYSLSGGSRGKNTAEKVGGGAVLGAIIGAIAGGGKGAAIGAGVGGAGGGVYQAATHGKEVKIPSETKLDFQLDQPVTIMVMPRSTPENQQ